MDLGDLVLELELALLEPRQLQQVGIRGLGHGLDHGIKVAMFLRQLGELGAGGNFVRTNNTGHCFFFRLPLAPSALRSAGAATGTSPIAALRALWEVGRRRPFVNSSPQRFTSGQS